MKIHKTVISFCLTLIFLSGCDNVTENNSINDRITAEEGLEQIYSLPIPDHERNNFLKVISADVDEKGKANKWRYTFAGGLVRYITIYYYNVSAGSAELDSTHNSSTTIAYSPIPPNWLDSDDVLRITEENGGREFRAVHSNRYKAVKYQIEMELQRPYEDHDFTYWRIRYFSTIDKDDELVFNINAITGEILPRYFLRD